MTTQALVFDRMAFSSLLFSRPSPRRRARRWKEQDSLVSARRRTLRLGVHILLPRREQRPQTAGDVGPLANQIVVLRDVGSQVEQHRPSAVHHQLPVARANGLL